MSQVLHIFRKDARHHWPEIVASLLLTGVFVWHQPKKWANQSIDIRMIAGLLNFVPALMVVSWTFLVARLVQGESLVGDRQFWITRPYVWHKLFGAKVLSIVAFIHVPLFIGQIVLLRLGKFPVKSSLGGLLEIQLMFILVFLVGALAIAVVTPSIGQAALTLLILFVLILGIAGISSIVPNAGMSDDLGGVQVLLYIGCCVTVVLLQYMRRKTRLSRSLMLGTVALIVLILVLGPYETLIRHKYPLPTNEHPLPAKFTFDRGLTFAHSERQPPKWIQDEISLEFPFQVGELDAHTLVQLQVIRLDLELPDGQRWTSHWHSASNVVSYGRTRTWPYLSMEAKFYDRIKDTPLKARVFLGMRSLRMGSATSITVEGSRTGLPGNTQCVDNVSEDLLQCFSALKRPKPIFIAAQLPNSECRVTKEATAEEQWAESPATYYDLESDSGPEFDFSPVQDFSVGLSKYYFYEDHEIRLPICAGTRLLVSKPQLQYYVRDEIDLGEITLSNYHPTYPRKVVPPAKRPGPGGPSNTLSSSVGAEIERVRLTAKD